MTRATLAPIDPAHYKSLSPEPITVIMSWDLPYCLGSALKYISRAGKKPDNSGPQDLRKAIRFLEFQIEAWESDS